MATLKRKFNSKFLMLILQSFVMCFLFLLLIDKQTAYIIRDILDQLQCDADIQAGLAKLFLSFKMTFDAPSIFAIVIVCIQVLCVTIVVRNIFIFIFVRRDIVNFDYNIDNFAVVEHIKSHSDCYLINSRLRN